MKKEDYINSKIKTLTSENIKEILGEVWNEAERSKTNQLENKLKEVIHYVELMMDFCKDNNTVAVKYLIRWIFCLTDPEYRKQFGEDTKKILKGYGIKA